MKRLAKFVLTVLFCAAITCPVSFWVGGNFDLFGTESFRFDWAVEGLLTAGIPSAIIIGSTISAVRYFVNSIIRKR